ncbi:MAG: HIT family protein [Bacteroidetes bacterium]|nr:HIT family protein [Bacteroidota bacterium]
MENQKSIFSKIIDREISAEIIYETDNVIAILDIMPVHFGHVLVIPKKEYKDFLAVPDDKLKEIFSAAQRIARALVKTFSLEGFNVFINNGEIAGQSIFHFHVHITPRYVNDGISFHRNLKKYEEGQMKEIAEKIKTNIS